MSELEQTPAPGEPVAGPAVYSAPDENAHGASAHAPEAEHGSGSLHVDRIEAIWMRIAIGVLSLFLLAVTISSFVWGIQLPGYYQRIDPTQVNAEGSPFADPQLRELAPGKYEAYIRAQVWAWTPAEIRVPVGSEIKFYITSQDVQHGFKLMNTNVNVMVLPGQISTLTHTFNEPGEYNYVCHEYCGLNHHTMFGTVIVEEPAAESEVADAD